LSHALPPAPAFGAALPIKPAPDVLDFLALRRSASAMTLTEPGPDAGDLAAILRIAARAPDHGKLAPWRFIVLEGQAKARLADRLEALARGRGDQVATAKLGKLKAPPVGVAVISSPRQAAIPEWEQLLSAGAVCSNMLNAALALGYGANWITDWYAYDAEAKQILGLGDGERVAGFIFMGTTKEAPLERERPDVSALTTRWVG
jgi:nitroreductase